MESIISVIVPVYNVEQYLEKCVNSILNQSIKDIEIILVDDGATDRSGQICDEYAAMHNNIKVIHKSNGGLSDARNAGLELATGSYVCFFDSDDWVEPDLLEKALATIKEKNVDSVIWGFNKDFVDNSENVVSTINVSIEDVVVSKNCNNSVLLSDNALALVGYAWNKLYSMALLKKSSVTFEKGTSLIEDILFNSKVLAEAKEIAFIEYRGTHYIQRNRITLGARFYDNYYQLKLRACQARWDLLVAFGIEPDKVAKALEDSYFAAIKSSFRMVCKTSIPHREKKQYMKCILDNPVARQTIKSYKPKGKNILFYLAFKMRQLWFFEVLYRK